MKNSTLSNPLLHKYERTEMYNFLSGKVMFLGFKRYHYGKWIDKNN